MAKYGVLVLTLSGSCELETNVRIGEAPTYALYCIHAEFQ